MARPKEKGLKYFPVDVVFDEKINAIESLFGNDGLVWVIKFWQSAYKNENGLVDLNGYFGEVLAKNCRITTEKQSEIINVALSVGLIFEYEEKKFTSNGIITRIKEVSKERESAVTRYYKNKDKNKDKNKVKDFGSSSAKYPQTISEILNIEISDINSDVNLDEEKQIDIKFWNQFADKNNLQKINGLDINQSFIQIYTELKLRKADKFDIKTAIQQIEKSNLLKPDYKYKPQNLNFYWLFKKDDNGILNYDNLITESKHFGNIDSYNQNATVKVEEDEHTKYIRRRKEWSILSILDKYKFEEIKLHIPKINNENDFEEIDYVNITSNLTKFSVSTEEKKQIILELLKLYPNEPIYKKWYEWTDYYFYTQKNKGCCQFENSKYKSEGKN